MSGSFIVHFHTILPPISSFSIHCNNFHASYAFNVLGAVVTLQQNTKQVKKRNFNILDSQIWSTQRNVPGNKMNSETKPQMLALFTETPLTQNLMTNIKLCIKLKQFMMINTSNLIYICCGLLYICSF